MQCSPRKSINTALKNKAITTKSRLEEKTEFGIGYYKVAHKYVTILLLHKIETFVIFSKNKIIFILYRKTIFQPS